MRKNENEKAVAYYLHQNLLWFHGSHLSLCIWFLLEAKAIWSLDVSPQTPKNPPPTLASRNYLLL
jgi:hypothetical protein